ncbi:MAG: outer membrane beta-barrel protein [Acidobacteriia bacterium]|nr:outer membrane beta-barrel protein [Terriglobia bacterium]
MKRIVVLVVGIALGLSVAASAQENRSEISLQGGGLFTKSTTGNGTSYNTTESGGVLGTYRYHLNHWISVEGAYGYSVNTQKYSLSSGAFRIQSGIHDFTGSLVLNLPSHRHSRVNPYLLAGGGALRFAPTNDQFNTLSGAQGQTKGAFVYGAGINYGIYKGLSLRAEYRGLVYSTPDFGFGALATNAVTHTAVPTVGLSFRF